MRWYIALIYHTLHLPYFLCLYFTKSVSTINCVLLFTWTMLINHKWKSNKKLQIRKLLRLQDKLIDKSFCCIEIFLYTAFFLYYGVIDLLDMYDLRLFITMVSLWVYIAFRQNTQCKVWQSSAMYHFATVILSTLYFTENIVLTLQTFL